MKKKTVKEVVLETIEYYENNPERRAVSSLGSCYYYDKDTGNMCAVGRCMKNAQQEYECSITMLEKLGEDVADEDIWKEMKEEYSDIPIRVWQELQGFHDRPENWNKTGLTQAGEIFKQELIESYCQN